MKSLSASAAEQMTHPEDSFEQDWGLLYGYGVFETLRAYDGVPFLLEEHVDRMLASTAALGFASVPDRREIVSSTMDYCRGLGGDRVVRITLTAGNPDVGLRSRLLLTHRPLPYTAAHYGVGISIGTATSTRDERSPLVRHKTLNQLQNVLEWRGARQRGFDECLFLNSAGHLAEGSRCNVFVVHGDEVSTPAADCGLLPGITRRLVIDLLRRERVRVREEIIRLDDLFAATECFVTNAVMGVMPVSRVDEQRFAEPIPGRLTSRVAAIYEQAVLSSTRR